MFGMLARLSPDVSVMLRPQRTFAYLNRLSNERSAWLFWRRPLLVVLIYCCGFSLMTEGRLSLHLAGSTAMYWLFLPLVEIAGLVAVQRGRLEARVIDRFFTGHGPWLLFVIAFSAYASSSSGAVTAPFVFRFWLV